MSEREQLQQQLTVAQAVLGVLEQPPAVQASFVQGLLSSQPKLTHEPAQHSWPGRHVNVSRQAVPTQVAV